MQPLTKRQRNTAMNQLLLTQAQRGQPFSSTRIPLLAAMGDLARVDGGEFTRKCTKTRGHLTTTQYWRATNRAMVKLVINTAGRLADIVNESRVEPELIALTCDLLDGLGTHSWAWVAMAAFELTRVANGDPSGNREAVFAAVEKRNNMQSFLRESMQHRLSSWTPPAPRASYLTERPTAARMSVLAGQRPEDCVNQQLLRLQEKNVKAAGWSELVKDAMEMAQTATKVGVTPDPHLLMTTPEETRRALNARRIQILSNLATVAGSGADIVKVEHIASRLATAAWPWAGSVLRDLAHRIATNEAADDGSTGLPQGMLGEIAVRKLGPILAQSAIWQPLISNADVSQVMEHARQRRQSPPPSYEDAVAAQVADKPSEPPKQAPQKGRRCAQCRVKLATVSEREHNNKPRRVWRCSGSCRHKDKGACYCNEECQRSHWRNTHKNECHKQQ